MKISNKHLLTSIFAFKGNFHKGIIPAEKAFDSVEVAIFRNNARAAICISADFELNWAWRHLSEQERNLRGATARRNLPFILELLEDYRIPVTWATVGHLFLDRCNRGVNGLTHPNMPRPPRNDKWDGDWYLHDPCTNVHKDPLWYAPDLVEQIIKSTIPHEIGTHSFSHIDFSSEYSNEELVRCEILECISAMKKFGLRPSSLVFPFNKMGDSHLGLLSELGISAIRYRDTKIRLSYPERTNVGIYKIYESMNLRKATFYDYWEKAKIFIKKAAERYAVYHLWFHPSDPTELFQNEFRRIIEYVYRERERGAVWVTTMGDLANYCYLREKVDMEIRREGSEIKLIIKNSYDLVKTGSFGLTLVLSDAEEPTALTIELDKDNQEHILRSFLFKRDERKLTINIPIETRAVRIIY